eukprot:TRINITY_DN2556_c2_g2_i1.p2 TRINITY_DN2556_c2_g2~~TRINITY_DN2556_c2_g2_i1.p2  ORF type:complete len:254 (+),score=54.79 TRINITY_DN2556_c2_g2_i1:1142-1903(+)
MCLLCVTLSMGIATAHGTTQPIIFRNSTIPTGKSGFFKPLFTNQQHVTIRVLEGERKLVSHNHEVGCFSFELEEPNAVIEIVIDVDWNNLVTVTAKEVHKSREASFVIDPNQNIAQAQLQKLVQSRRITGGTPELAPDPCSVFSETRQLWTILAPVFVAHARDVDSVWSLLPSELLSLVVNKLVFVHLAPQGWLLPVSAPADALFVVKESKFVCDNGGKKLTSEEIDHMIREAERCTVEDQSVVYGGLVEEID